MPVGAASEPLDLVDIRKEQRRCAALLGYKPTWRLISGARVSNKNYAGSNMKRTNNNLRVPLNSPSTPHLRQQSSKRLQHVTFEDDSHVDDDAFDHERANSERRVKPSFYDASRKVLEKLRMQQRLGTDADRNGQADVQSPFVKDRKLQKRISIVSIADIQTRSTNRDDELRGTSRRDGVAGNFDLALRLEPTPHPERWDDECLDFHDSRFSELARDAQKEECGLNDFHTESSRKTVHSGGKHLELLPSQLTQSCKDATLKRKTELDSLPKLDSLPTLLRKKSQSILGKESYDQAVLEARRRLIRNGFFPGVYTTCEFTFSYYNKIRGYPSKTSPRRQRGKLNKI